MYQFHFNAVLWHRLPESHYSKIVSVLWNNSCTVTALGSEICKKYFSTQVKPLQIVTGNRIREIIDFFFLMWISLYISWAKCIMLLYTPSISCCRADISLLSLLASSRIECPSFSNCLPRLSNRRDWIRKLSILTNYISHYAPQSHPEVPVHKLATLVS